MQLRLIESESILSHCLSEFTSTAACCCCMIRSWLQADSAFPHFPGREASPGATPPNQCFRALFRRDVQRTEGVIFPDGRDKTRYGY